MASDILQDVQKLTEQQVALTRLQFFEDWDKFKPLAVWIGLGVFALSSASLLFSLTLVFVLNETTKFPLWACFGMTVMLFLVFATASFYIARQKSQDFSHD